jgi:hypothetical protein
MSPKTFKIKKESKEFKCPDSSLKSRSAPSYEMDYHSLSHELYSDGMNEKKDKEMNNQVVMGFDMPELSKNGRPLDQDDDDPVGEFKVVDYFDTFVKIFIKVITKGVEPSIVFPMVVRKFVGNL